MPWSSLTGCGCPWWPYSLLCLWQLPLLINLFTSHYNIKRWECSWLLFHRWEKVTHPRCLDGEQRSRIGNQDGLEGREVIGVFGWAWGFMVLGTPASRIPEQGPGADLSRQCVGGPLVEQEVGRPTLGGIVSPSWVMFPPKLGKGQGELDPRDYSKHADRNLFPAVWGCDQSWDLLHFSSWAVWGEEGHSRWKDIAHSSLLGWPQDQSKEARSWVTCSPLAQSATLKEQVRYNYYYWTIPLQCDISWLTDIVNIVPDIFWALTILHLMLWYLV